MTNIFINLINSWSKYEIVRESIFLLLIFLAVVLTTYFSTKEKRMTLLIGLSFISAALINILGIFLSSILVDVQITEVFRIIPVLTSLILVTNIGLLIGFYISKKEKKDFKISVVRNEYFSDTLKQSLFLLLLICSMLFFVATKTQIILIVSGISATASMLLTHYLSKHILK